MEHLSAVADAASDVPRADAVPWTLAGKLKLTEAELARACAAIRSAHRERDAAVRTRDEALAERDAVRAHYERHVDALEERVRALGEKVRAQLAHNPGEDGVRRVAELV